LLALVRGAHAERGGGTLKLDASTVVRAIKRVETAYYPLPDRELETELWVPAHPDIRHLQRVKLLFDFLKEDVTL
jgi:hypothetical protein